MKKQEKNSGKGKISVGRLLFLPLLAFITAIAYKLTLGHLGDRLSDIPLYLLVGGGVAYLLLCLAGAPKIGATVLAMCNFAAFIVFAVTIYEYPMEQIMVSPNIADIKDLPEIIGCAVAMLVGALIGNVMAWKRVKVKEDKEA